MSPAIISYKEFSIKIYPDDHKPIHVHAIAGLHGARVVFSTRLEDIIGVEYKNLKGYKPLTPNMRKDLKKLVAAMGYTMVRDFKTFVVDKKELHNTIYISKL